MNPAERFEDEKRRIIDSCFSKREEDGSVSESYITHIRVKEDAEFPSSPPPPDSSAANKKDRVIVVAVRRAGRVRMHKARENGNGTFSIGKTWMLDHLSAIESFTGVQPRSPEEAQRKAWGSDTGMLITIQKPYFWKATSSKEKDFFISSLVKIHRKYAGRDPQLSGFTPQEMASFAGPGTRQPSRQGPSPGQLRASGPPPASLPPNGGAMMPRPGPDPTLAMGRERLPSTSSAGSSRPSFGRRDMAPGFPEEQDQRNRLDPVRSGSPAASTISDMSFAGRPPPSTISDASYGGSTLIGDRERRQESLNSFDSFQPRSPLPLGRNSSERLPLNGTAAAAGGVAPRYGSPGAPPPPVVNPRSPDRRGPREMGSVPLGTGVSAIPGLSTTRLENVPADRRRLPATSSQTSLGQSNQSGPEEFLPRNDLFARNESVASNISAGSQSEISRPSTGGLQGSPQKPPALNVSTDSRRPDFLRPMQPSATPTSALTASSGPLAGPDALPFSPDVVNQARPQADPYVAAQLMQKESVEEQQPPRERSAPPPVQTVSDIASKLALMSPTDSASPSTSTTPEESYRPGLGPMIKKSDVANRFRKAATAAAAFRPRPGGAGDLALKNLDKQNDTGDGITGVFVPLKSPLPQAKPMDFEKLLDQPKSPVTTTMVSSPPATPAKTTEPEKPPEEPVTVKLAPPHVDALRIETPQTGPPKTSSKNMEESKPKQVNPEELRKKQISVHATKYAKALGVNPILLEGRTADIEAIFDDIGWVEGKPLKRTFDDLQAEIKRELSRVETGSWLDAFEGTDDRVTAVSTMLDKTIAECEELDGLLTLYNVELGTLNQDIQFIENQSHGLQVQTANQRQLALELQNLLKTISIPSSKLAALQDSSLSRPDSLAAAEDALSELYKALVTIDPNMARSEDSIRTEQRGIDGILGGGIGNMQAVQDKRATYIREANDFVLRLRHQLESKYKEAEAQVQNALGRSRNSLPDGVKLDIDAWDSGRRMLWMYSPIMLFARNVVPSEWEELVAMYGNTIKSTYRAELRKSIDGWKVVARRPTGQEQDALFTTSQEKEAEGMARKLTVKRSKTLRESPKIGIGDRGQQQGKIPAYQAFYSALLEICKAIFIEQNFVVKLFHATSTDASEFTDLIKAAHPQDRSGDKNLIDSGPPEFGGPYGPRIKQQVANIFYTFTTDLQGLIDLIVDQSPLNLVGVMFAIEDNLEKVQHTNQDFLSENLNRAHDDLERKYIRFIDEQMTAIDATKVKISKRKGVIQFMKVFPLFAGALEDMLPSPSADNSDIRGMVNNDYQKIYRAMSKALVEVGNKDQDTNAGDDEKEQLNHHILLIENHNHYIEEVDVRNNPVLIQGREDSESTMNQHMEQYVNSVIQRPLGPLLSHVEQLEAGVDVAVADGKTASSIATQASYRPAPFRKTVGAFDAKEIRKGVELLRKRVEKHFGDADDERISSRLVEKVTRECEQKYYNVLERTQRIARDVYESQVEVELRKEDIAAAFQK